MSLTYQDIHLEDKALWQQLKTAWDSGNYSSALNVLKQAALSDKQLNAATLNAVTAELARLQNQKDDDFKMDKIKVATEPPSDLAVGEVYFKNLGKADGYDEEDAIFIETLQKSAASSYVTLNPYVYATDVKLPISMQHNKNIMSLDAALANLGTIFL